MDVGSITLALAAGMLAAVNPCGFALLPAYLSVFVLDRQEPAPRVARLRALRATAALTLGFTLVFAVFGLAVAPVAASVQSYLPGFTVALGLLVAAAGLWLLAGRRLPAPRLGRRGSTRPITASWLSMTGFGASYAVASLGCTIAPFLAVVVPSFRSGSIGAGITLFLAYGIGMGIVVGVAAVATALARRSLVNRLRSLGRVLPRVGGLVLLLAGAYVAWYGVWELRVLHTDVGTDPVVEAAGSVQRWLAARVEAVGFGGLILLLGVLVAVSLLPHRRRSRPPPLAPPNPGLTPSHPIKEKSLECKPSSTAP
jgi:cytochrome c-type biogenesis protein